MFITQAAVSHGIFEGGLMLILLLSSVVAVVSFLASLVVVGDGQGMSFVDKVMNSVFLVSVVIAMSCLIVILIRSVMGGA